MACRAASTARILSAGATDPHECRSGVLHDRADVREVEIDETRHRDDVTDSLHALAQDVVHDPEGVEDGGVLLDDVSEPIVRDGDQGVDLALEFLGRLLRGQLALRAFERERLRHDADRQGAGGLGHLGDHGRRPGSGASTEARRDEDHVRPFERGRDLVRVLFGGALADVAVTTGTEAAGDLVPDPDLVRRVRLKECLRVGVEGDELDPHHLGPDHPVDGVAAAAAHSDDTDESEVLRIRTQGHRTPPWPREAGAEPSATGTRSECQAGSAGRPGSFGESTIRSDSRDPVNRLLDRPRSCPPYGKMLRNESRNRPSIPKAGADS